MAKFIKNKNIDLKRHLETNEEIPVQDSRKEGIPDWQVLAFRGTSLLVIDGEAEYCF